MERDITGRLIQGIIDMKQYEIARKRLNEIQSLSNDPSTKVGCVLLDKDFIVLSSGCNRKPSYWNDVQFPWSDRDEKNKYVIHAEMSAVLALRNDTPHYAMVTLFPCLNCAKLLSEIGVKEIMYKDIRINNDSSSVMSLLNLCGISVTKLP